MVFLRLVYVPATAMHIRAFLFLMFSFFAANVNAQKIKILSSTLQRWSGGVAGHSGSNYSFEIEFSGYHTEPVPDTIWLDRQPRPLLVANAADLSTANTRRKRKKNAVAYTITESTSKSEENLNYYPTPLKSEHKPAHPPVNYKGAALLSYHYNGKQYYFEIPKIMKQLTPINYP